MPRETLRTYWMVLQKFSVSGCYPTASSLSDIGTCDISLMQIMVFSLTCWVSLRNVNLSWFIWGPCKEILDSKFAKNRTSQVPLLQKRDLERESDFPIKENGNWWNSWGWKPVYGFHTYQWVFICWKGRISHITSQAIKLHKFGEEETWSKDMNTSSF